MIPAFCLRRYKVTLSTSPQLVPPRCPHRISVSNLVDILHPFCTSSVYACSHPINGTFRASFIVFSTCSLYFLELREAKSEGSMRYGDECCRPCCYWQNGRRRDELACMEENSMWIITDLAVEVRKTEERGLKMVAWHFRGDPRGLGMSR